MKKHVVIIGGGYGGLSTAALFSKAGYKVTVLEKNEQLGGRAGQVVQDGFRFDTGPSWYLMPEVFEDFYALFDLDVSTELELTRLSPGYKVFFESNDPITIYGDLEKDSKTFEAAEAGAGSRLRRYVEKSEYIYRLCLNEILFNPYRSLTWLFRPDVIKALPRFGYMALTSLHMHVSRNFAESRLQRILEYHCVFLGTSPFQAPAIYSLMSVLDFKSGVYFPKGGIYSLIENMVTIGRSYGVSYRTNAAVASIETSGATATGVLLKSGEFIAGDIVISAADLHHTETVLVPEEARSFPDTYWKKKQPGPSALLLSLGIKGKVQNLEHHNLYFVDKWEQNFSDIYKTKTVPEKPSIYICCPSRTDVSSAPENDENIFMLVPLPAGVSLSTEQTERLSDYCLALLAKLSGDETIDSRIVTQDITVPKDFEERYNAWQFNALGGASHILQQSAFFRTPGKSKKLDNLYYVGAGTNPGIGLPMCLISAELAYKNVHGITNGQPLSRIQKDDA